MMPLNAIGNIDALTAAISSGVSFISASRTLGNGETRSLFGVGVGRLSESTAAKLKSPLRSAGSFTVCVHSPFGSPSKRTDSSSPA